MSRWVSTWQSMVIRNRRNDSAHQLFSWAEGDAALGTGASSHRILRMEHWHITVSLNLRIEFAAHRRMQDSASTYRLTFIREAR